MSLRVCLVAIAATGLLGCATSGVPGVMDTLATADTSARGPINTSLNMPNGQLDGDNGRAGVGDAQFYPGDDTGLQRGRKLDFKGVKSVQGGYDLNFDNANLSDVVKVVLGDTLRETYSVDPRVQGKVTFSTGRSVSRDELISILEVVLTTQTAALLHDDAGYRVIPLQEALQGTTESVTIADPNEKTPAGYGISILPLHYVSAASMMKILDGFVSRPGSLRIETSRNLLLIRGGGGERDGLIDVAASFDVDWMKGQSAAVFPLTRSEPDEIISELEGVFQTEGDGPGKDTVRFQPLQRLNAVLVLSRRSEMLGDVGSWIRRLDSESSDDLHLYSYHVENGKAGEIAEILLDVFGEGGGSTHRAQREDATETSVAPSLQTATLQSSNNTGTASSGQSNGRLPKIQRKKRDSSLTSGQAGNVHIVADASTNSLLIRASRKEYRKIRSVLRRIDVPPLQVHINATIAEVTLNDQLRFGVQVYLRKQGEAGGGWFNGTDLTLNPSFPGLNFILGSQTDPRLVLDALSGVTNVKVVSSPSLVVLNNESATLQVGDEVPITTQTAQSVTDPDAPIVNSIQFRNTGVILTVTPRVNSNGQVMMDIEQEVSNIVSSPGDTTTLTPTISQRKIASSVSVYSGQLVVLGGLISERKIHDKQGTPLIDKIPLIGDLVGTREDTGARTELIVFIQPNVLRDGRDQARLTEELRGRLQMLSRAADAHASRRPELSESEQRPAPDGQGWDATTHAAPAYSNDK